MPILLSLLQGRLLTSPLGAGLMPISLDIALAPALPAREKNEQSNAGARPAAADILPQCRRTLVYRGQGNDERHMDVTNLETLELAWRGVGEGHGHCG